MPWIEKFDDLYTPEPTTGCWLWTGHVSPRGYARCRIPQGPTVRVARYIIEAGPNELACHRCDQPACVNPAHLYRGTAHDNYHDMKSRGRDRGSTMTHCKRGHLYDEANTHWRARPGLASPARLCRACNRERVAAFKLRKRIGDLVTR